MPLHFPRALAVACALGALATTAPHLQAQQLAASPLELPARVDARAAVIPTPALEATLAPDAASARARPPVGPLRDASAVAARTPREARPLAPSAAARSMGLGQARALMFVGLAAFVAGALMDSDAGTIFMVGGAGVGLFGLYQFLQ